MLAARVASLFAFAFAASAVQVQDLQNFFTSPNGLSMTTAAAYTLAVKEAPYLTKCSVTVPALQALRNALYAPTGQGLGMTLTAVQTNLLPLAYQHADPKDLTTLFYYLYSPSSVGLPLAQAQSTAMALAQKHVESRLLAPLYSVFYSLGFPQAQRQQQAIDLTAAGADAPKLQASYLNYVKSMPQDAALQAAIKDAVSFNLNGLASRYADDGKLYTAQVFQSYYGAQWLAQWQAGVPEKRTSADGLNYTAAEFFQFFADSWATRWNAAPAAQQRRISEDGKTYTIEEFEQFYSTKWEAEWFKSYEVVDVCAGLDLGTCAAQRNCLWKATGDPTTSCVARPLMVSDELTV